jgi:hypothetical protein
MNRASSCRPAAIDVVTTVVAIIASQGLIRHHSQLDVYGRIWFGTE